MAGEVRIVLRSFSEAASGPEAAWEDPEGIAPLTRGKLHALRTNPFRGGDDDPTQLLALAGRRVIGRVDVFPGEIVARGEAVPVYWGSSLWVSPGFRSTAAGAMLVLRMAALDRPVAGCGFSPAAFPIYRALHWIPFEMPRHVLVRRSRPVIEGLISRGGRLPRGVRRPLARALGCFADPLLAVPRALRRARAAVRAGLRCRAVASLPPHLEEALRAPSEPIFCHRSVRYLDWLLASNLADAGTSPRRNDKRLFLVEDSAGRAVAYFLVTVRFRAAASRHAYPDVVLGSLKDWFVFDRARVSPADVVVLATQELGRLHVDAIEICTPEPGMEEACRRLGLRRFGSTHFMYRPSRGSRLAAPELARRELWRITPAEGDGCLS